MVDKFSKRVFYHLKIPFGLLNRQWFYFVIIPTFRCVNFDYNYIFNSGFISISNAK